MTEMNACRGIDIKIIALLFEMSCPQRPRKLHQELDPNKNINEWIDR